MLVNGVGLLFPIYFLPSPKQIPIFESSLFLSPANAYTRIKFSLLARMKVLNINKMQWEKKGKVIYQYLKIRGWAKTGI